MDEVCCVQAVDGARDGEGEEPDDVGAYQLREGGRGVGERTAGVKEKRGVSQMRVRGERARDKVLLRCCYGVAKVLL
jgi:hypothetical protein